MTLVEHLRELRNRLIKSVLALVVCMMVAWIFYDTLFALLQEPYKTTVEQLQAERPGMDQRLVIGDIAGPLMLRLKISFVAGLVAASPVWLYQLWAFIVPGLHKNERKWTLTFVSAAAPLFIAGVLVGYFALPKGMAVLLDFTPADVSNLTELDRYLSFTLRLLLVFGIAFEIPIFVVLLNLVGVLSVARLSKMRAWIIFGIFVFAAVATPSTDPFTMLLLAIPMMILYLASELIARFVEGRRKSRLAEQGIDIDAIEKAGKLDD